MSATPGGTKKKPRLAIRKSVSPLTHSNLTIRNCNRSVSSSIPMILAGNFSPVTITTSSPNARHPKSIKHCLTIVYYPYTDLAVRMVQRYE